MKKILLLLANGFEVLESSAFIDVMGWNYLEGDGSTKLYSCALCREIKSSFDQRFIVDYLIDEINISEFDALAVPGGFEEYGYYKDAYDPRFLNIIKEFNSKNKPIASVCVGALPLAKSGILKDKEATTYPNPTRQQEIKNNGAILSDKQIIQIENIITSTGPSTAIEVAFMFLERLTSKDNALRVRELMGYS